MARARPIPAPVNYLSPIMSVRITAPDGEQLDLRTDFRLNLGIEEPVIQSVSVTQNMGQVGEISVVLSSRFEVLNTIIDNRLKFFLPGNTVGVVMGYASGSRTFEFEGILQPPQINLGSDNGFPTFTLQAPGAIWFSSRHEVTLKAEDEPIIDLLRRFAAEYSAGIYYLDPERGEVLLEGTVPSALSALNNRITQQLDGRLYFVMKSLVERNAGLRFYTSGRRIVIFSVKERALDTQAPIFWFRGGDNIDVERGLYPMFNVDSENSQYPITAQLRKIVTKDIDPDTKQRSDTEVTRDSPGLDVEGNRPYGFPEEGRLVPPSVSDSFSQLAGGLAQAIGAAIGGGPNPFASLPSDHPMKLSSRDPNRGEKLIGAKNAGETLGGITLSWDTMGNPQITPGMICEVRNCTRLFSGTYYIREIEHTGDMSGFKTRVTAFTMGRSKTRNGFFQEQSAAGDKQVEALQGQINEGSKPPLPTS